MNLQEIIVSEKQTVKGKEINAKVANAMRNLKEEEVIFSKAVVYLEDLGENYNGYLFSKNEKQIFILWNQEKKRISEMIFSEKPSAFTEEEILQAVILLEALDETVVELKEDVTDVTGFQLGSRFPVLFTKENEEMFAEAVLSLEKAIQNESIRIYQTSNDEFEVKKTGDNYFNFLTDETEVEVAKVAEVIEFKKEENKDEVMEKVAETVGEAKQISLFGDETVVQVTKTAKTTEKVTETSSRKKREKREKEEVVVKMIQPAITMEQVKASRPDVFDDKKTVAKLRLVNADSSIIDFVMAFRKVQRETLSAELLMDVPEKQSYVGSPEPIEQALAAFLTGCHMLIKGVTSTGKTTMTKTVLNLLNLPMYFAGGSQDASIETFVGFKTLEDGNISVKNAPLLKAMKNGGAFYLDEGNAVMESVLILMHSTIDDERTIYNEMTGEQVYAHPNFRFVTTINPGYAGTNEMNLATNDRLVSIEMGHLKEKDLEYLLNNYDGGYSEFQKESIKMGDISRADIAILTEVAKRLQGAVKADEFSISPEAASTRNILQLLRLTRVLPFPKAIKMIIAKYPPEDRPAIEAALKPIGVLKITATSIYHS